MKSRDRQYATARDFQRNLFIGSLSEQLSKMASATASLEKVAESYIEQGMHPSEVSEILMADGYDHDLVRSFMQQFASEPKSQDPVQVKWGFRIADSYGRIVSHAELEITIDASDKESAQAQAEQLVESAGKDAGFRYVVDVFPIEGE